MPQGEAPDQMPRRRDEEKRSARDGHEASSSTAACGTLGKPGSGGPRAGSAVSSGQGDDGLLPHEEAFEGPPLSSLRGPASAPDGGFDDAADAVREGAAVPRDTVGEVEGPARRLPSGPGGPEVGDGPAVVVGGEASAPGPRGLVEAEPPRPNDGGVEHPRPPPRRTQQASTDPVARAGNDRRGEAAPVEAGAPSCLVHAAADDADPSNAPPSPENVADARPSARMPEADPRGVSPAASDAGEANRPIAPATAGALEATDPVSTAAQRAAGDWTIGTATGRAPSPLTVAEAEAELLESVEELRRRRQALEHEGRELWEAESARRLTEAQEARAAAFADEDRRLLAEEERRLAEVRRDADLGRLQRGAEFEEVDGALVAAGAVASSEAGTRALHPVPVRGMRPQRYAEAEELPEGVRRAAEHRPLEGVLDDLEGLAERARGSGAGLTVEEFEKVEGQQRARQVERMVILRGQAEDEKRAITLGMALRLQRSVRCALARRRLARLRSSKIDSEAKVHTL